MLWESTLPCSGHSGLRQLSFFTSRGPCRRKNCGARNRPQTLARRRVRAGPPTVHRGSTGRVRAGRIGSGRPICGTCARPMDGIVKLRLTAVSDAQHGGFTTGSSRAYWGVGRLAFRQLDSTVAAARRSGRSSVPVSSTSALTNAGTIFGTAGTRPPHGHKKRFRAAYRPS